MIKVPTGRINVTYEYQDEYGNTTTLSKDVESDYLGETELGILNEIYCDFLLAAGFSYLAGKKIEFVDWY